VFPTDNGYDDKDEEVSYPRELLIPSKVRERLRLLFGLVGDGRYAPIHGLETRK